MTGARAGSGWALLLTPIIPDPKGVGLARRAWRWAAELSARYALDILVVTPGPHTAPPPPLPGKVRVVHRVEAPTSSRNLADWFDPDAAIAQTISSLWGPTPERVVIFRLYLHDVAALLPPVWRKAAEIDCDDWESATRGSLALIALRQGRYLLAWRRLSEAIRYARIERTLLSTYRTVHISAFEDAARLRRFTGLSSIKVSPNKIAPEPALAPAAAMPNTRTLLFVGALFYPPNEDAIRWFGKAVLPRLRRLAPDVRVVAAGLAEENLQRSLAMDGIDYVHAPADLRPIYADATAVIAPLRGGGGTKLKVLEAWLHERPLVATSHAVRGLHAEAGRHFLVADRASEFARSCAALLTDKELALRLCRAGRDLLHAQYVTDEPRAIAWTEGRLASQK